MDTVTTRAMSGPECPAVVTVPALLSLARALLDEIAADPAARERLRELVGDSRPDPFTNTTAAFTVATLAGELGRSERSIRAAIARGELEAVKRGRGWLVTSDAVERWASASAPRGQRPRGSRSIRRGGKGPMSRALNGGNLMAQALEREQCEDDYSHDHE